MRDRATSGSEVQPNHEEKQEEGSNEQHREELPLRRDEEAEGAERRGGRRGARQARQWNEQRQPKAIQPSHSPPRCKWRGEAHSAPAQPPVHAASRWAGARAS
eukprot:4850630-Pleurochrysis_carterae.AAC.3